MPVPCGQHLAPERGRSPAFLDALPSKPTIILRTGGGLHAHWLGLQAFSAENLLCILQLFILLTFRHQVIKKGIRKPLHFGLQNQGFLPMREPIIYESLCDQYEQ